MNSWQECCTANGNLNTSKLQLGVNSCNINKIIVMYVPKSWPNSIRLNQKGWLLKAWDNEYQNKYLNKSLFFFFATPSWILSMKASHDGQVYITVSTYDKIINKYHPALQYRETSQDLLPTATESNTQVGNELSKLIYSGA